jgi:hypothetical protein
METLSQSELVHRLAAIFPPFATEWAADTEGAAFPSSSLHSVYQSFLPFVSGFPATDKQWSALSKLLNGEVAAGGDRENAVATCFLEHCSQVGLVGKLRPLLDGPARSRLHA